jgi:hypothetical protein
VPSFRLIHVSGEDLGVKRFADVTWKVGDEIPLGGGNLRRRRGRLARRGPRVAGTLTVKAVV